MPKVVISETLVSDALKPLLGLADIVQCERFGNEEKKWEALKTASAWISTLNDTIGAKELERCPRLKIIANYAVGYDNIDIDAATAQKIQVSNTPDVLTDATADLTLALMLAVMRRIPEAERALRAGLYPGWAPTFMLSDGLQQKTMGIVGFGSIGKAVARRALAFGLRVVYCRSRLGALSSWAGRADELSFDDVLAQSDILSLHVPGGLGTKNLLSEAEFTKMKPSAYLINTSRASVVDEQALIRALKEGSIRGAGLDVFADEPRLNPDLLRLERLVVLPHLGSNTYDARLAMGHLAAQNIASVLKGDAPLTPVFSERRRMS